MLCLEAKEHGVWLVGGSIPEKHVAKESSSTEIYNTVSALAQIVINFYVSRSESLHMLARH